MKTTTTTLTETDENLQRWIVTHNSDWSGEAILKRLKIQRSGAMPVVEEEFTLPGKAVLALAECLIEGRLEELLDTIFPLVHQILSGASAKRAD